MSESHIESVYLGGDMNYEREFLGVTLDCYASRIKYFMENGTTTSRSLVAVMMEEGLVCDPEEGYSLLNLLVVTKRLYLPTE